MKKAISPFCSFLASALCFLFISIPNIVVTTALLGNIVKYSAWNFMSDYNDNINGYVLYKVTIIVMIVLAGLLLVSSILLALERMGNLKIKNINLDFINNILLVLFVVANVILLIAAIIVCSYLKSDDYALISNAKIGIGIWLNLGFSVALCIASWMFSNPKSAKKKSKRK